MDAFHNINTPRKRLAAVGAVLCVLAAVSILVWSGLPDVPRVEQVVAFDAETLDDERLTIAPQPGRPVVLNFWATWCAPCVIEMPILEDAYQQHRDDGLLLVGINLAEDPEMVESWLNENDINFPVVIDRFRELEAAYEVRGYPTTFFIDARGNIRRVHQGPLSEDELAENLRRIGIG
jgi:thiol-disulfide isomerase/thioredoxin